MREFLGLELKKFHFLRHLKGILVVILGMLLFETLGILNSPGSGRDSYSSYMPRMISLLTTTCFIIYSSVFTTNLIIGEYTKKTILILFSYPVNRKKIILLKLCIVVFFTALCIIAGNFACHAYLMILDGFFNILDGSVTGAYLLICLKDSLYGALMGGILSTLPFVFGMRRKSIPAAFISSVIVSGIFMEAVGIAPEGLVIPVMSAGIAAAAVLAVLYTLRHSVEQLDTCA